MGSTASPGPPQPWADFLRSERHRLERLGLRRSVVTPESRAGVRACLAGREYVLFTSNDYLGLAAHPDVIAAGAEAAGRFGAGAGSARLLHGSTPLHEDLQERLARMTGRQSSLLFSSGYMANLGLLSALAGSGDAIFYDERAHASIIDGAKLSGAAALPYPHNDAGRLDDLLRRTHARRRLVATESVFSMDGDLAPLDALGKTASRHHAMLVVDEAHAIGLSAAAPVSWDASISTPRPPSPVRFRRRWARSAAWSPATKPSSTSSSTAPAPSSSIPRCRRRRWPRPPPPSMSRGRSRGDGSGSSTSGQPCAPG